MEKARKKVYVGLSGGVDSAVSAALLKEAGHDVTGVFIKIWQPEFLECTWRTDRLDAMRVAAHLGIPFREIDLSAEYEREVIRTMIASYQAGCTPNPDIACNTFIKFGAFLDWAVREGADMVATGHYARTGERNGAPILMRGRDSSKDQSYFLAALDRDQLSRAMFPIGDLQKTEVRARAETLDLPVASKPDSQGLCFVGDISMPEFLRRYISVQDGDIVDEAGSVVGAHHGAVLYTIGQRHGFELFDSARKTPHYVISIDVSSNRITISADREKAARTSVALRDTSWVSRPIAEQRYVAQTRYREAPVAFRFDDDSLSRITFDRPHLVSPGQSFVVYDGEFVLGSGIIEK